MAIIAQLFGSNVGRVKRLDKFLSILLVILILPGCVPVEAIVPSPTPIPTRSVATRTPTPSPAATQTPPPALTWTPRPTMTPTPTITPTLEWGGRQVAVMMVYFNGMRLQNQIPQALRKYLTPTPYETLLKIPTSALSDGSRLPWGKVIFLDKDGTSYILFSALLRAVEKVTGIPNLKGAKPSAFVVFEIPVRGGSNFYIPQYGDTTIESVNYDSAVPTVARGELRAGKIPVEWLKSSREHPASYWEINWVYRLPQFDAAEFYRKRIGQAVLLAMPVDQSEDNRQFGQSLENGMLLPNYGYWDVMVIPSIVMPDSTR